MKADPGVIVPQPSDSVPFKFVAVEPEQDELVIHAGVDCAAEQASPDDQHPAAGARVIAEGEEPPAEAGEAASGKGDAPVKGPASEKPGDSYRETTLDDLDHAPMSKLQRGVLIGIGVLVVAFIAYALIF